MIGGLGLSEILAIGMPLVVALLLIYFWFNRLGCTPETNGAVMEKKTQWPQSIIALIAIIAYFAIPTQPYIFYGAYGAVLFGIICGIIASIKYRNPVVWFAFGLWFVLASLIVLIFMPKLNLFTCPYCREGIKPGAIVCPHCQRDLDQDLEKIQNR